MHTEICDQNPQLISLLHVINHGNLFYDLGGEHLIGDVESGSEGSVTLITVSWVPNDLVVYLKLSSSGSGDEQNNKYLNQQLKNSVLYVGHRANIYIIKAKKRIKTHISCKKKKMATKK